MIVSDEEDATPPAKKTAKPAAVMHKSAAAAKQKKRPAHPDVEDAIDEDEAPDEDDSPRSKPKSSPAKNKAATVRSAAGGMKYTPLQLQVLEVKAKNSDVLLYVSSSLPLLVIPRF